MRPLTMRLPLLALLAPLAAGTAAWAAPPSACEAPIASAQRSTGFPDRLLDSIALVESGRRSDPADRARPWPWTVDAEGVGRFYDTKAEAVAAVRAMQARGIRSIDVGCLQVNLLHHPGAFASLEEAFDPGANAAYAARFLSQLHAETGDWGSAATAYHSRTPGIGAPYGRSVLALWQRTRPWSGQPDSTPLTAKAAAQYTPAFARERAAAAAEWSARRARAAAEFAELHGLAAGRPAASNTVSRFLTLAR